MGDVPAVALRDGNLMPQLGFGTWQIPAADCPRVVGEALRAGYRAIDTAQGFGNEDGIGQAIRDSGVARDEIFVTSKFNKENHSVDGVQRAYDESLRRTGLDYLDLFLTRRRGCAPDRTLRARRASRHHRRPG